MGAHDQQVYKVIKYSIIAGLVISFLVLLISSIIVADTKYIENHPFRFFFETFFMGIMTSIPIAYLSYMRGATSNSKIFRDSCLFFLKIVLIHLGFQLSGVYTAVFSAV